MNRSIACWLRFCAFLLLAIAILFPASAAKAVTVYMSSNSNDVNQYTPPGPVSNFAHLPSNANPEGLAFDTLGNLFVAGNAGVSKITPGGVVSDFATLPAGGYGMAIDTGNNLYVAAVSGHGISKITPGGTVSSFATLDGSFDPTGLTFDTLGNLYAAAGNTIREITSGGAVSTYATLAGHVNTYGLAFDSAGYLYVSDITSTTLLKIPPGGGSFSDFATTLSSGPKGLIFDSSGILYAAQPNEDKISTIASDGTASTFGLGLNGPRYLAVQPANVSEPSSIVMLGLGLIAARAFFRRRKPAVGASLETV
jgi:sugar lactone lactonase YvrE